MRRHPPLLAQFLLSLVLPRQRREEVLEDLREAFGRDSEESGVRIARRLYWREVLSPGAYQLRFAAWRRLRLKTKTRNPRMEAMREIGLALRRLRKAPLFTCLCLLSFTLGIGANTAVFTIIHAALIRPLDFPHPERLVRLWEIVGPSRGWAASTPNLRDWRQQNSAFESIAAYSFPETFNLAGADRPETLEGVRLEPFLTELLGVAPALGRFFLPEEGQAGRDQVVLLSDGLWKRRFGGRESALGSTIRLNQIPHLVIGVMPEGFSWPPRSRAELWTPLTIPEWSLNQRNNHWVNVIGRLKAQASLDQARVEMNGIASRVGLDEPHPRGARGVLLRTLHESLVGETREALWGLWSAVAIVLLIGCANVANLLLARGEGARREVAIRSALGASRTRIVRLMAAEALILTLGGAILGLALSQWGVGCLSGLAGSSVPIGASLDLNAAVLVFCLVSSLISAGIASVVPALRASRAEAGEVLRNTSRGARERTRDWIQSGLVTVEVALSVVVLAGAGLLLTSYSRLLSVDPGVAPQGVLTFKIPLAGPRFEDPVRQVAFYQRLLEEVESIPGCEAAGLVSLLPYDGYGISRAVFLEGIEREPGEAVPFTEFRSVSGSYFQALGFRLLSGRLMGSEAEEPVPAVLVNKAFSDAYLGGADPVGQRLAWHGFENSSYRMTIVGMVGDVRSAGLDRAPLPEIYVPLARAPRREMWAALLTSESPLNLAAPIRERVRALDPEQPVAEMRVMEQVIQESMAARRFNLLLMSLFASIALAMALAGVYGVMSYTFGRRTSEIALRLALGARRRDIRTLVLRGSLNPSGLGIAVGLLASFWLTGLLRSQLYSVEPNDPATLATVSAMILLVSLLAAALPAYRASRVDPMHSLRAS